MSSLPAETPRARAMRQVELDAGLLLKCAEEIVAEGRKIYPSVLADVDPAAPDVQGAVLSALTACSALRHLDVLPVGYAVRELFTECGLINPLGDAPGVRLLKRFALHRAMTTGSIAPWDQVEKGLAAMADSVLEEHGICLPAV